MIRALLRGGLAVEGAPFGQHGLADALPRRHRVVVGLREQARADELPGEGALHGVRKRAGDTRMSQVLAVGPCLLPGRFHADRPRGDHERHFRRPARCQRHDPRTLGQSPHPGPGPVDSGPFAQQAERSKRVIGEERIVAVQSGVPGGAFVVDQGHDAVPGIRLGRSP